MDELIRQAPKTLLAIIAIALGFFLIVMFNPPRTACHEQLDLFMQSQKSFLSPSSEKLKRSAMEDMVDLCKSDNGPGGCFDLFLNFRSMVDGLERIPKHCAEVVSADEKLKKVVFRSLTLFAQIAWGDSDSGVYVSRKHGWLDAADFRLYCRMKTVATRLYGDDNFATFRESVMTNLPGAEKLSRDQRWTRSIFSSPCDSY